MMVLASQSQCKGSNAPTFNSPVVYEERIRPEHWLASVP